MLVIKKTIPDEVDPEKKTSQKKHFNEVEMCLIDKAIEYFLSQGRIDRYFPCKNNGYLFLADIPENAKYVIGVPALNSSGDVYHVMAFLFLSELLGFKLPDVIFAYNSRGSTKSHSERSFYFMRSLFSESDENSTVSMREVVSGDQPVAKLTALRKYVSEIPTPHYYIDQKATTLLVARLMAHAGFEKGIEMLRILFVSRVAIALMKRDKLSLPFVTWTNNQFDRIVKASAEKPVLLFNLRYSSGANSEQNIGQQELAAIKKIAEEKGIFVWFLDISSRLAWLPSDQTTRVFEPSADVTEEMYKIRHLLLLGRLRQLPHLIGMAGNTSGTLDIAAMLGFRVYDFHYFVPSRDLYFDAQDYRLLLQHWFLSIGLPLRPGPNVPSDKDGKAFKYWLDRASPSERQFPQLPDRVVGIPSRRTFADYRIHEDRLPFAGVLTWEVADDTRNLPESSLNVKTSPKFIPFQFFSATDDALRKMLISEKPDLTADDCDIDLESVDRHLNELVNPRG